jgi:ABC-type transporter MlaC component
MNRQGDNSMKLKLLLITLGLALAFSGSVLAQEDRGGHRPVATLKAALGLTEDQVTQLRELNQERSSAIEEITEEIKLAKQRLEEETQSEEPDAQVIGELILTINELRQEVGEHQQVFQTAFRDMLTEEQLRRLAQVKRIALMNRAAEALNQLKLH